jgi:hypothetical protein
VATLALHSLFELRKGIMSGTVMLDVNANNLLEITGTRPSIMALGVDARE